MCEKNKIAATGACGLTVIATFLVTMGGDAGAQSSLRDRQMQIEQSIRRSYNARPHINSQQPAPYRFREQHLYRAPSVGGGIAVAPKCAYQYRRWQRSGSSYWQDRYLDCAG